MLLRRPLIRTIPLLGCVLAETCKTHTVRSTHPEQIDGNEVALQSYSYCAGTLNATAYVANVTTDRQVLYLWYTNRDNVSTPLAGVSLSLLSAVGTDGQWEIWGASTPVAVHGITELLNITYEANGIGKTYHQILDIPLDGDDQPPPALSSPPAPYATPEGLMADISDYLAPRDGSEASIALARLFLNINPAIEGAAKGVAVAAGSGPSFAEKEPNYEYVWVRDTSLAMDVVQKLYSATTKPAVRAEYERVMFQYAAARAQEQNDPDLNAGLGHARFWMNNTAWYDPRSQNDGPATAASALISFAESYLAFGGDVATVKRLVYDSMSAPVKRDLLYTAQNWDVPTVDIWEGVVGDHFYDRMVQRRALVMGTSFAQRMGDTETAQALSTAANALTQSLGPFWDPARQILLYEYGPVLRNESSYLDVATILGIVHGQAHDGMYDFTNDKVLSAALRVATVWIDIFPIANMTTDSEGNTLGIPIGRFPEDMYNGTATGPGNPWYMATAAYAQFMYGAVAEYESDRHIRVTNISKPFFDYFAPKAGLCAGHTYPKRSLSYQQTLDSLKGWGDAFMRRIKHSTPPNGHLREEYDRHTGIGVGVADLTWSYASVLTAAFARAEVSGQRGYMGGLANRGFTPNS